MSARTNTRKASPVSVRKVGEPIEAAVVVEPKARTTRKSASTTAPKETTVSKSTTPKSKGRDFKALATKAPTDLHKNFAAWLTEQTGVEVDLKTVQLVAVLRMDYQRSEANQADLKARQEKAAKQEADRKAAKMARLQKEAAALGLTFSSQA